MKASYKPDLVRRLEAENYRLRAGLKAVEDLIADSHGVAGLHLNGDIAPWAELRTGGRFEEWMIAFDDALSQNAEAEVASTKCSALRKISEIVRIHDLYQGPPCHNARHPDSTVIVRIQHGEDVVILTLGDCRAIANANHEAP